MSSTLDIPLAYNILFLYFEPLAALHGVYLAYFDPPAFLEVFTAIGVYAPDAKVIYDQLAASYLLFVFNEAVVLRVAKDLRVWKTMLLGILLCDVLHLYASWQVMGGAFWNPTAWRGLEWGNHGMLIGMVAVRVAFLLEAGFPTVVRGRREGKSRDIHAD
ncbi:hypothetical protein P154DRAFT_94160 [Amniculicola lignicola CBS 123094]|uniref:DUF7704 domain-containing protein n=1 Tax=Amniculicola lignicola CBS 123094 TaxID=1392246 RepID=A0A6A5WQW7_9PLEO|nr:hypothetical protein P154DRAFT_94160 [Amniculicola lignicola CBS 123094]